MADIIRDPDAGKFRERTIPHPESAVGVDPLPKKSKRDKSREPPPLRRSIDDEPDTGDDGELIDLDAPTLHIDAQTGAAVFEDPETQDTIIDFGGRDTARDRKPAKQAPGRTGFNENLALKPGMPLATLAMRVLEMVEEDLRARAEWEEMGNKGADLLGVKWEDATVDVSPEGAISKAHHPMLMEALLKSWANARAELLPAGGPVKVRDDLPAQPHMQMAQAAGAEAAGTPGSPGGLGPGDAMTPNPNQPGARRRRDEKAEALEKDMNHNLTAVDREYYPDTSRMLMVRAAKGSQFKKVYYDPILARPVSRWVLGTDLIVSNDGKSLQSVSRITERSMVRQAVVKRYMAMGHWRDVKLGHASTTIVSGTDQKTAELTGIAAPTSSHIPANVPHLFYEISCECDEGDLAYDENGDDVDYPLPYRITIAVERREIVDIVRDWKEGDPRHLRRTKYVHYGMVPTITSNFYHWGLFHLMGSAERAATAMSRLFIDSEMLASFPGGVAMKGPSAAGDSMTIRGGPGQFAVVNTGGVPIKDFVMPWPYKGASAQLGTILEGVVSEARRMAGTLDIPVGEGMANVPVGTIMAMVDSVSKVPSAVHKDDHMAQQEEFLLLKELFAEHPECLLSEDDRTWTAEELNDAELVPAADPNTPSYVHRVMQAMAVIEILKIFMQFPALMNIPNGRAIWDWILGVIGVEAIEDFTMPPQPAQPPPPDPAAAAAMMKAQNDAEKNQIQKQKLANDATKEQRQAAADSVESDDRAADRAAEQNIENTRLAIERERLAGETQRANQDRALDLHKHNTGLAHEAAQGEADRGVAHLQHQQTLDHQAGVAADQNDLARETAASKNQSTKKDDQS